MLSLPKFIFALIAALSAVFGEPALAQDQTIVVASTTSTNDTGLFSYLLPLFTRKSGIAVTVTGVGTGQALDTARRGDADVVFVHYKIAEQQFVAEGHGVKRYPVMYNDFILVGPKQDPARIEGQTDVVKALETIRDKQATFISRGDHSGTHLTELALWHRDAGINIENEGGAWYRSAVRGMDAALHLARATGGYTLTDRGTWLHFEDKDSLKIMVEGDQRLFNQYGVILVNPDRHPNVNKEFGQRFIDWLVSEEGQRAIGDYKINGKALFVPNAEDPNA
jgi:tungstate transport system substrate-binding protein